MTAAARLLLPALVAALLAFAACGGSEGSDLGMTFELPDGWTQREDGATVHAAADGADLDTDVPAGPRLRIERLEDAETASDVVMRALGPDRQHVSGAISVAGEPVALEVGGQRAVSITIEDRRDAGVITYRHVFVSRDEPGVAYRFTFAAPASKWADASKTFDAVLASVVFD